MNKIRMLSVTVLVVFSIHWAPFSCSAGWSEMDSGTINNLWDIWGFSQNNFFIVGEIGKIIHYDGYGFSSMSAPTTEALFGIWGSSPSEIYAVGGTKILRYNGASWQTMSGYSGSDFKGVWGFSSNDVYVVGFRSAQHFNGSSWSSIGDVLYQLHDVWGSSTSDVFAVGESGAIFHYNGSSLVKMNSGYASTLYSVWGFSADNVYAVGADADNGGRGTILHWDGSAWSNIFQDPNNGTALYDIWGSGPNDIFAVSVKGYVFHYNGSTWSKMNTGTSLGLHGIWGSSSQSVYAVGSVGTVVKYSPDLTLRVRIEVQPTFVHPYDSFSVTGYLDNSGSSLSAVPVFFILDVFGSYYFWPSWTEIDFSYRDVPNGTTIIPVFPTFTWPDTGTSTVNGLRFWGAMLTSSMTDILGDYDMVVWGYGP